MVKLNYKFSLSLQTNNKYPIVLIHGLFGDLNNLQVLSNSLRLEHHVLQFDLRNHGKSVHINSMTYKEMSQDIILLLNLLTIEKCILIGHSVGGKVAMYLCRLIPERIASIVILDIAPVSYDISKHDNIFTAIEKVTQAGINKRQQAFQIMQEDISDKKVIMFLLKSFNNGKWLFNNISIKHNYSELNGWQESIPSLKKILFIKGELSRYLNINNYREIWRQFPRAEIKEIPNTGHWVHYEKPIIVLQNIFHFIND